MAPLPHPPQSFDLPTSAIQSAIEVTLSGRFALSSGLLESPAESLGGFLLKPLIETDGPELWLWGFFGFGDCCVCEVCEPLKDNTVYDWFPRPL